MIEYLLRDFSNANSIQEENLIQILKKDAHTTFGTKYGFPGIDSVESYQKKIPLTTYETYRDRDWTELSLRYILTTSGTTGKQKEFGLTQEALNRYGSYIYEMPYFLNGSCEGPHLHTSVFRTVVHGKTLLSVAYFTYLKEQGILDCEAFLGGEELWFSDEVDNIPYVKLYLALCSKELKSIQSIFLYDILLLCGYLEEHWRMLLSDLKHRRFSVSLKPRVRERLLSCTIEKERLEELENIFLEGFDQPVLPRIWKQLTHISGISGEVFAFQERALKRYVGDLPIYYFAFASSECMSGVALNMNQAEYAMLPRSAFYEYLSRDGRILRTSELQIGACYELVVTTFSGLYRYQTGDLLKLVRLEQETPVFQVVGRKNQMINIAGEKLDEITVKEAVKIWAKERRIMIEDFAMGADTVSVPSGYWLFVKADRKICPQDEERFEQILKLLSPDYEDVRNMHMLQPVKIRRCKTIWKNEKEQVHKKPRTFLNDRQTENLLNGEET